MKRFVSLSLLLSLAIAISQPAIHAQGKQDKKNNPSKTSMAATPATGEFGNVEGITAAQMKEFLTFLASDELEGRDTPSRGLDTAAKFIAFNLTRWGFKPAGDNGTFFQRFMLRRGQLDKDQTKLQFGGQSYKVGEDFIAQPVMGAAAGSLVYVGHGFVIKAKNINPYEGIDVKDKILVVNTLPSALQQDAMKGVLGKDYDNPLHYASTHGAKGVVIVPAPMVLNNWSGIARQSMGGGRPSLEPPQDFGGLPVVIASKKLIEAIFQGEQIDSAAVLKQAESGEVSSSFTLKADKQISFEVKGTLESLPTQNVVAIWEGSDETLKSEYIAVGAHYDHVGVRPASDEGKTDTWSRYKNFLDSAGRNGGPDKLWNGADDDGSGTTGVLSIAEALAKGGHPKRSVLLVWHAGEEKGLLGSQYVTDHPPVPVKQIVTQLNIDMIGRTKLEAKKGNENLTGVDEIYVIGSKLMSTELGQVSEAVNNSYLKLKFNYKYDDPTDRERLFYRSDHFNYARKGIPIIFYFDGVHEDYHQAGDQVEKIDFVKMEKVARTVFATMWKLANAPTRPKVDKPLPAQYSN